MNERNNGSRPENGKNAVGKDRSRGFGEGSQRNERTIGEIISDATDEELRKYHTGTLTPEELNAAVEKSRRAGRRRMLRRLTAVAALLVIAVAGAFFAFENFTTNVDADKNAKEEIVTEDGVVIEDGGWGGKYEQSWEVTDWNEVIAVKASIPQLLIPRYIPEGYNFSQLVINELDNIKVMEYLFKNNENKELIIQQNVQGENTSYTQIHESDKTVYSEKGIIYFFENPDINNAIIQIDDSIMIYIWAKLDDTEIVKIVEGIEN